MSVFLETVKSEGLSHLSYLLGQGREAVVVDPRRDVGIYLDMANARGARITYIFETHRNEDYVIGSQELARLTGATIHHGHPTDFAYGRPLHEGDVFEVGTLRLKILETPGHTFDSISIVVVDTDFSDDPVAVFTGDALFIGDVGRTDFFPDKKEKVAGLLYDSIFEKLLPLGDHVMLLPAHGAGSVCGSNMAEREFSTLGYEKLNNSVLQVTGRDEFIRRKVAEHHYMPPYFKKMEEYNQQGNAPDVGRVNSPVPLDPEAFEKLMGQEAQILDCRPPEAFAGAFIPGSLAMPLSLLPAYAGYFLRYERPIGLVVHDQEESETAVRGLLRLGFDRVEGRLVDGMQSWEISGRKYDRIPAVHASELVDRIQGGADFTLLDVRKEEEFAAGHLPGARHIFLGHLADRLDELPREKPVVTFCGSGVRAIVAASILKRARFEQVEDALGSMAACMSYGCPLET